MGAAEALVAAMLVAVGTWAADGAEVDADAEAGAAVGRDESDAGRASMRGAVAVWASASAVAETEAST